MSGSDDELLERYLARLNAAASGLSPERRHELIDEITAHITEAMAVTPPQPGGIRTVLDQLGSPEEIARAAGAAALPRAPGGGLGAAEIIAVIALLVGGIVVPVAGWVVGVVLLWTSPRWRTRDKLLGTLVWPGGLLAAVLAFLLAGASTMVVASSCSSHLTSNNAGHGTTVTTHCTPPPVPPWLAITLTIVIMLASVVGPILVAIRLVRQARRNAARPAEAGHDLLATPLPA